MRKDHADYSVMILGGGTMQLPGIRIAKRKGWHVIVADGSREAPGIQLADQFVNIDLKDMPGMYRAAAKYRKKGKLDGVFTAGTDFSTTVAYVAEKLGLPGITFEAAVNATDKARMREVFRKEGIPSPDYVELTSVDDPLVRSFPLPAVVKPVDNMGARGVRQVAARGECAPAIEASIAQSRSGRAIMESYMEGPELSLDAIVYKGEFHLCGVADRIIAFSPNFVEMGHTLPSALPDEDVFEAIRVFKMGIAALGITDGAAKGDIKVTREGVKIGEIAARLSGGYMSGWTYPCASGIEPTESALNIAVGLPPIDLNPVKTDVAAERGVLSIPGIVDSIQGVESAKAIRNVKQLFVRVQTGDRVVFPTNNVEKCANVITSAENREQAIAAAEIAAREIIIRLSAGNSDTERFLYSSQMSQQAYALHCPANRLALESMPPFKNGIGAMAIIPLPALEKESSLDWHGRQLKEAYDRVKVMTGVGDRISGSSYLLGNLFWKALLKGGVQGGVYLVDTLARMRSKAKELADAAA